MSEIIELDITNEHCPMTFVKTKLKLETMAVGGHLRVRLKKGEPLENVPRTVKEQGHLVLEINHIEDDIFEVLIQRG